MINNEISNEDEGSGSGSGERTQRFKGSLSERRDDALPPEEAKRLLLQHKELNQKAVRDARNEQQNRQALKEGPVNLTSAATRVQGAGSGTRGSSPYKEHPISKKFRGEGKTTPIPDQNIAEINAERQNELQNRLTHQPSPSLSFTPTLRPYSR